MKCDGCGHEFPERKLHSVYINKYGYRMLMCSLCVFAYIDIIYGLDGIVSEYEVK